MTMTLYHIPLTIQKQRGWLPAPAKQPVETATIPEASEDSITRNWLWMCGERAKMLMVEWEKGDLTYFDRWVAEWDEAGVLVPLGMMNLDAWRHARQVLRRARQVICNGE
jgi:hypothetical protein